MLKFYFMANSTDSKLSLFQPKENNYHSNKIIDSRHDFSLLEKKFIYCIINQLECSTNPQQNLFGDLQFKIPLSTFGEDYSHSTVKEAIKKIVTRSITGGNDKKKEFWAITPIPSAKVANGIVSLTLFSEAVPYFIDLKQRGYTEYQLDIALSLTSIYSQRLYELLKRWKDTRHWRNVSIDHLKWLLGLDKKSAYEKHWPLINRVLEPARIEIAEKTDIEFIYSFRKEGKKCVAIDFEVFPKALIKHIEKADAKEQVVETLEQLADATQGQQMRFLHEALAQYTFTATQQKQIIRDNNLTLKFIELHTQIALGVIEVKKTPTSLIAWHLTQMGLKK